MTLSSAARSLCPRFLQGHLARLEGSPLYRQVARGAFWLLAGVFILRGLEVAASIFVARLLGKVGFGELGIIQGSVAMLGVFAGLGLGISATKYVAEFREKDPARAGRIIGLLARVSLGSGMAMTLGLVLFSPWLATRVLNAPHLSRFLREAAPLLIFGAWSGTLSGALAGLEAFKRMAWVNLMVGLLNFPMMVGGAYSHGLAGAIGGQVAASLIGSLIFHRALKAEMAKAGVPASQADALAEFPVLWKFSLPSLLVGVMASPITWACSAMLLNRPDGYAELGIFNAANQWYQVLMFLPGIIGPATLPILCRTVGEDDKRVSTKILTLSMIANAVLVLPLVLGICLFPATIMGLYGSGFAASGPVLILIALTGGLVAAQTSAAYFIVASGRMWLGFFMNVGWGAAFLLFTSLFVHRGAFGLALARLIAYALHACWTFGFAVITLKRLSPQEGADLRAKNEPEQPSPDRPHTP